MIYAARNSTPKTSEDPGPGSPCGVLFSSEVCPSYCADDEVGPSVSLRFPGAFPAGKNIMDMRHEQNRRAGTLEEKGLLNIGYTNS